MSTGCSATSRSGSLVLRPDTGLLWEHLKEHAGLSGFILVGGTALSMHLNHRLSEDLDFMTTARRLPRQQIEALKRECGQAGFPFSSNDSPQGLIEFEDTGLDYLDYQQDYIVCGSVKLTLVAPDPEVAIHLNEARQGSPRVASLEEIFRLKCMACADRTKSRDWLDVYLLLRSGQFQPMDIYRTFERAGVLQKLDIAMARMTRGKISASDEGYESLLDEPPTVAQMQRYFGEVFDEVQVQASRLRVLDVEGGRGPR